MGRNGIVYVIRNIDREKYDVEVIITGRPGDMLALLPQDVKCTVLNIRRSRYAFWHLGKMLKKIKPDVVFSVSLRFDAQAAWLARFIFRLHFKISVRYCLMPQRQMIKEGFMKPTSLRHRIDSSLFFIMSIALLPSIGI